MLVVGLTGNIASGKSTVARALATRGVRIIDSDLLAREAVGRGSPALARIEARWGKGVIAPDGGLDRGALRAIVFASPAEREALDGIVHPEVARRRESILAGARAAGDSVVVCDIPLLFEANLTASVDVIVLVDAPSPLRLERLMKDRHLGSREAEVMIAAQMPSGLKRPRADYVIDNSGTLDQLGSRVSEVWNAIVQRARG